VRNELISGAAVGVLAFGAFVAWTYAHDLPAGHDNGSLMRLRAAMTAVARGGDGEAEFADAIGLAKAAGEPADEQAALLMRGEARLGRGELAGAEADFTAVTAFDASKWRYASTDDRAFLGYVDRAIVRVRNGDSKAAEADLTAALGAIPDYATERMGWYDGQHANGMAWTLDCGATIAESTRVLATATGGDAVIALGQRAWCRQPTDPVGAANDRARINEIAQNPGLVYFFRGVLEQRDGDCERARADYAEAVRLNPAPRQEPLTRRSATGELYGYHADWFAAAVGTGAVSGRFRDVAANQAACGG
jgi:tetratricopeptide (TPR) repeat protein